METAKADLKKIALICTEKAYAADLKKIQAPSSVLYEFLDEADDEYAATFDTLFLFSSDPDTLIKEQRARVKKVEWEGKQIVFIVPDDCMHKAKEMLREEMQGLISLEKFREHSEQAMEVICDHPFLLNPEVNYELAEEVKQRKERQQPISRFKLIPERVDVDLRKSELNILQLLLDGKSTPEMAEELYYSVKTVKRYVSNLIRGVGVSDRTGVVVHAIRNEWVDCERE
ncbi:response regulator transcription factor [Bacillus daqingensis]|uniref:Response regulator transcription factor n=1 Tax=Bacillus daqingensis TaxID=872396 RepID=A0ABV9NY77_9BACI